MARISTRSQWGFTFIDMVVVIAVVGIVSAIGLPTMMGAIDRMRLGQSAREVERELQMAKSRAVAKGRPIRVRFNCPTAGEYRIVELIGSPGVQRPLMLRRTAAARRLTHIRRVTMTRQPVPTWMVPSGTWTRP